MDLPWFALGLFALGIGREFDRLLTNLKLHDLQLEDAAIGRIIGAHQMGTLLVALPTAFLLSRLRIRWLLTCATFLTSGGIYLVHLERTEHLMMLGEFCLGAGLSIPFVTALPLALDRAKRRKRTFWIAIAPAMYAVSGMLTSPIAGFLAEAESPEKALRYGAVFPLFAILAFVRLGDLTPTHERRSNLPRLIGARLLLVVNFLTGLATGLSVPFLNLFLRREADFLPVAIGTTFAVVHVASSVSYFLAPRVEGWFGIRRGAIAGEFLIGALVLILALTRHPGLLVAILVVRGASMALTFPLFKRLLMESVERSERRWLAGISSFLWNASMVFGSVLGGVLLERANFTTLLATSTAAYLACALLLVFRQEMSKPLAPDARTHADMPTEDDVETTPPHALDP